MIKMTITVTSGDDIGTEPVQYVVEVEPNLSPETYQRIAAGVLFLNDWCDDSDVDYTWTFEN